VISGATAAPSPAAAHFQGFVPTERVTLLPRQATMFYRTQSQSGQPTQPTTTVLSCSTVEERLSR
jgi:hypothetical protein